MLAHAVATSLRGSALFLVLGLAVVVVVMRRGAVRSAVPAVGAAATDRRLSAVATGPEYSLDEYDGDVAVRDLFPSAAQAEGERRCS